MWDRKEEELRSSKVGITAADRLLGGMHTLHREREMTENEK